MKNQNKEKKKSVDKNKKKALIHYNDWAWSNVKRDALKSAGYVRKEDVREEDVREEDVHERIKKRKALSTLLKSIDYSHIF